jgi:hypothetical protein
MAVALASVVLTSGTLGLRASGGRANDCPSTARGRVVAVWTFSPRASETLIRARFPQGVRPDGRASLMCAPEGVRRGPARSSRAVQCGPPPSVQSSREEEDHGSLRWPGRACAELHAGSNRALGQTPQVDGGGDERTGTGGGGTKYSWASAPVLGGGNAERLVVRAAGPAGGGSGGGGARGAEGPQGRPRDAWTRAEELRTGAIQTRVYKAPQHLAALRNAVRAYGFAVRDVVRAKNRLKSVFLSRGIEADAAVYEAKSRSKWLPKLPRPHRDLAEWLGQQLDGLVPLREAAEEWLRREAKTHPIIRTLSTAPGMGIIRSAQMVAVVAVPERFRTRRQFWSYSGLSIVTRSSADWVRDRSGRLTRSHVHQTRGLTRKRNALLKSVFKGAATTVIAQLPDDPLRIAYERALQAGMKPNLAKLTLARRIAGTVAVDVEEPGGVRPGSTSARDRQDAGALVGEASAARCVFGDTAREGFEGEHPLVSCSPGRDGESPDAGYAPSEYPLKRWPFEAQSGAWCPRFTGGQARFRFELLTGRSDSAAPRISSPPVHSRGSARCQKGALAGVSNRPSHDWPRANGRELS